MSTAFHIRPAETGDVDTILQLIVDLATYEKQPESVKATPELLRQNLFDTPYAHALLAFSGPATSPGEAIGLALYFFNYSTWTGRPGLYLEDLFVKLEYRGRGIAKALFAELAKIAQEKVVPLTIPLRGKVLVLNNYFHMKNCARLDWAVLKWNQPSIDFYEKSLGASSMSEWMGMRLEGQGIENLKKFAINSAT